VSRGKPDENERDQKLTTTMILPKFGRNVLQQSKSNANKLAHDGGRKRSFGCFEEEKAPRGFAARFNTCISREEKYPLPLDSGFDQNSQTIFGTSFNQGTCGTDDKFRLAGRHEKPKHERIYIQDTAKNIDCNYDNQ
jgi:hypothetical protein